MFNLQKKKRKMRQQKLKLFFEMLIIKLKRISFFSHILAHRKDILSTKLLEMQRHCKTSA